MNFFFAGGEGEVGTLYFTIRNNDGKLNRYGQGEKESNGVITNVCT